MCTETTGHAFGHWANQNNLTRVAQGGGDQFVAPAIPSKPSSAAGHYAGGTIFCYPANLPAIAGPSNLTVRCHMTKYGLIGYLAVLVAFAAKTAMGVLLPEWHGLRFGEKHWLRMGPMYRPVFPVATVLHKFPALHLSDSSYWIIRSCSGA